MCAFGDDGDFNCSSTVEKTPRRHARLEVGRGSDVGVSNEQIFDGIHKHLDSRLVVPEWDSILE